jgi:hypothetical protein
MRLESGNRSVDGSNWDTVEVAYGKNLTTTEGDLTVIADDDIYLGGNADSAHDLNIIANRDKYGGGIVGNVKVEGNLEADDDVFVSGRNIDVDGRVTADDDVRMYARDFAHNGVDGDVEVDGKVEAGDDITIKATDDIRLGGSWVYGRFVSADAGDDIVLKADEGDFGYPHGGDVDVEGDLLAGGDIDVYASDNTIYLAGDVLTDNGDITFHNKVIADGWGDQLFDADGWGKDLKAYGDIDKTTWGNLTLDGGFGPYAKIYLHGDVTTEDGDLTFEDEVIARGWGDQRLDAGGKYHDLIAEDDIKKTTRGDLTLDAGKDPFASIYLKGDVETKNGNLIFEDDVIANGHGD